MAMRVVGFQVVVDEEAVVVRPHLAPRLGLRERTLDHTHSEERLQMCLLGTLPRPYPTPIMRQRPLLPHSP